MVIDIGGIIGSFGVREGIQWRWHRQTNCTKDYDESAQLFGFLRVLRFFFGLIWVVSGFIRFYRVSLGSTGLRSDIFSDVTTFYWAFSDFTTFYWAFHGFSLD